MLSGLKVNPWVFFPSAGLILAFVLVGVTLSGPMETFFLALQDFIVDNFGWFYILSVAGFLIFVLWLPFSRYGNIRLGKDHDRPEFSFATWVAMLFSAGMGIGLVFYGVAEPLLHFGNPPFARARSVEAAREALNLTFFHWGFHAWAVYIVVGLSLAYFAYRHDLPLTIRSTLYPLLGERVHGWPGHLVDTLAVFGTMFGLATSLGLGVMQINAGLEYLGVLSVSLANQIALITVISLAAMASVLSGLGNGIRRLSELNMGVAGLLLAFVLVVGPTVFLISTFVQGTGQYLSNLVQMTFRTDAFVGLDWQKSWTMFYWGWWISWSPFVGMFIARVSRGRTIREFVIGVLLLPTLMTFVWMTVFGASAIHFDQLGRGALVSAVGDNVATAVFVMLAELPLSVVAATLTTLVVAIFFVTSSDSGSLVMDILSSGGRQDTPAGQKIFWALLVGGVAAILLLVGGLSALQTAAVTTALPFAAIMVLVCVALFQALGEEKPVPGRIGELWRTRQALPASAATPTVPAAAATPEGAFASARPRFVENRGEARDWRERLRQITAEPEPSYQQTVKGLEEARRVLRAFIQDTVVPAFRDIAVELESQGRAVTISPEQDRAQIAVFLDGKEEFRYGIEGHAREDVAFAWPKFDTKRRPVRPVADVVLRSGKRSEHDARSLSRQQIIEDFIKAYAKWMGW